MEPNLSRSLPAVRFTALQRAGNALLGAIAGLSFLLLFHNYGLTLLPPERISIPPSKIYPLPGPTSFAYFFNYRASEPDEGNNTRSQVQFFENETLYKSRMRLDDEVRLAGGDRWSHQSTRIVFGTTDNSDPRTNGRRYWVLSPRLYKRTFGYFAAAIFAVSTVLLYRLNRNLAAAPANAPSSGGRFKWHVGGAALLLLAGLYCNTGTLAPYANTTFAEFVKETGYLYNPDHIHFRALYEFVNGAPEKAWHNALFIRRILFYPLAWPFMRVWGFEVGGAIASLVINTAALVATIMLLRNRIGERGAVMAGWLLALYPGAAYWGGLPYPHAMISPVSMLSMIALLDLPEARAPKLIGLSLALGVGYLSYDLAAFFLPASIIVLLWQRRWIAVGFSALLQIVPLALWLVILSRGLGQPLENSNSVAYHAILKAYLSIKSFSTWWLDVHNFVNNGLTEWFGANLLFLPGLFLVVLALNPVTSRIRMHRAEIALIAVSVGLFLFNNLAPDYTGAAWDMRSTWISRIYQPVFPACVLFIARWWQALPPLGPVLRALVPFSLAAAACGNALIIFGPILNNPLRVSQRAFYSFYDHTDSRWVYEAQLRDYGRRPIGFPRPQK